MQNSAIATATDGNKNLKHPTLARDRPLIMEKEWPGLAILASQQRQRSGLKPAFWYSWEPLTSQRRQRPLILIPLAAVPEVREIASRFKPLVGVLTVVVSTQGNPDRLWLMFIQGLQKPCIGAVTPGYARIILKQSGCRF